MATEFTSVDEYLTAAPPQIRRALVRVRSAILKAVPQAVETISYKMPTYKLNGRTLLHLAGWKSYYSLYPASAQLVAAFKGELAPYLAGKSTLRFSISEPVPVKLVGRVAKFRAELLANK